MLLSADHSKVGRPVKLVCYCSVGYRSSKLATRLQTLLHRQSDEMASPLAGSNQSPAKTDVQVFNLEGSLFQWANENRPLISETGERTRFVHPYSAVWGRLVDTSRHKWNASGWTIGLPSQVCHEVILHYLWHIDYSQNQSGCQGIMLWPS